MDTTNEQLSKPSRQYMENWHWIEEHINELIDQHPNQWVAVHGGRVLAADHERGRAAEIARRAAEAEDIVVHFVDDGSLIF